MDPNNEIEDAGHRGPALYKHSQIVSSTWIELNLKEISKHIRLITIDLKISDQFYDNFYAELGQLGQFYSKCKSTVYQPKQLL